MHAKLSYAVAERSKKGEDRFVEKPEGASALFGVFDGHGGRLASTYGAQHLATKLHGMGAHATSEDIASAFWEADKELGQKGDTDGSTATCLLAAHHAESDGYDCTLAWVGDSQALVIDLAAQSEKPAVVAESSRHCADDPTEKQRLKNTWEISKAIRIAAAQGQTTKPRTLDGEYAPQSILEWAQKLDITLNDSEAALVGRAIERGDRIDAKRNVLAPGELDASLMTSVLAPRVPGGKEFLHKVNTPSSSTHGGNVFGPGTGVTGARAIGSAATFASQDALAAGIKQGGLRTVSTAVTRAIGDWDGSRALVPHPEVTRFRVTSSQCVRAVIASDGLWDLVSPDEASEVLRTGKSATSCANRLLEKALYRSNTKFNELKDDTTVMVVELNPSGEPPPVAPAGGGCCVVS